MIYRWLNGVEAHLDDWNVTWEGYGPEWKTRAYRLPGEVEYNPIGVMNHHTASTSWYPKDKLIYSCNFYVDPAGKVWIMGLGYQRDSGSGDPAVLERIRKGEPVGKPMDYLVSQRINGNPYFIDIEVGHPGDGSEIPQVQRDALLHLNAALISYLKADVKTALIGHDEWTRRKIDPEWSYKGKPDSMEYIRRDTVTLLEGGMPRKQFENMVKALFVGRPDEFKGNPAYFYSNVADGGIYDDPENVDWINFWNSFVDVIAGGA